MATKGEDPPEFKEDIEETDLMRWGRLFGALKAYKDLLKPIAEEVRQEEGVTIKHIGIPSSNSNSMDTSRGQDYMGVLNQMVKAGWKPYNVNSKVDVRVSYQEGERNVTCNWIKYNLTGANPQVMGTQGPGQQVYYKDLHANLHPLPSFSDPKQFWDNTLHVFNPKHGSRALCD